MRKHTLILIGILVLAGVLRLYGLSRGDPINDEVLMSFRAIGLVDFDEAEFQTTPIEWFDPLVAVSPSVPLHYQLVSGAPWWVHLSSHDQPPLVYVVQHIFMKIFSEHPWAFRLPSALLGIVSVYLIYCIGKEIQNTSLGLLSALFYATTLNAVYISRTGMQESYVIFFMLWMVYALLCAREQKKFYVLAGIALGLGILSKYTALFWGTPLAILWILWRDRATFQSKYFWIGVCCVLLLASPMIIYNVMLYRTVGHFDFQFSTIFHQLHPAWQVQPGKDIGTLGDRMREFFPRMVATNSWIFLGLFGISLVGFLWQLLKNFRGTLQRHAFLLLWFVVTLLLLLAIGPAYRFLTMLTPVMALSIGCFLSFFLQSLHSNPLTFLARPSGLTQGFALRSLRKAENRPAPGSKPVRELLWRLFFTMIVVFEIFYSWNNQITYYPKGPEPWFLSKVRYENYNWGYNELGSYFEKEFSGKVPALTFDLRYQFLNEFRDRALKTGTERGDVPYPALVVTYGNFDKAGKLWALDRLHVYHAWPIISLSDYYNYLKKNGSDFYTRTGFKNFYFIIPTNSVASLEFSQLVAGLAPIEIKNPRGDTAFLVYQKKQ